MAKNAVIHKAFLNAKRILRRTVEHNSGTLRALACDGGLLSGNAGALKAGGQSFVLGANFVRQAIAKLLKELSSSSYFFRPIGGIHAEQFIERLTRDLKAVEVE